ncbi:MAG: hypothetical protein BWY15_01840 [Firmicutes bacterium ADurb.Bin193]|nr:MAG: hypothetical protein BWY15_01840 [Firmicutes bacterium ADurb.Bin193]
MDYKRWLENLLTGLECEGKIPSLLLHSCCAPCSSYVLEYLSSRFDITLLYYNPNIFPKEEYDKRLKTLKELIMKMDAQNLITLIEGEYENDRFSEITRGYEDEAEGGKRCRLCYALRLEEAAAAAKRLNLDYFTTTLSVSPHKNAEWINETGAQMAEKYGVPYLYSDFKKNNGYKRSIELSKAYGLYRQDYCGCKWSKRG